LNHLISEYLLEKQTISTRNRPDQIAWWLKRGRKANIVPVIDKLSEFEAAWKRWWEGMQPGWRLDDKMKLARKVTDNPENAWSSSTLYHAGPIGFRLIIMALAWWGEVIKDQQQAEFFKAVEDVQWVLEQILQSFASKPMTMKRQVDDDENDAQSFKR
jgi:hypothetical protein